jgi:hypothetical protein
MIIGKRNNIDPVPGFNDIKVVLPSCSRRYSPICPYGKDTEGMGRF